jgi:2-methylcitrate dehydratase PrpD
LYGPLAAATAASKILKLNESQTVHALGWAANCGSGLLQCAIAQNLEEMLFQAGFASSNGVICALLAQEGAVACDSALDGERGFYQAFAGTRERLTSIVHGLGEKWEMMDTFFKRYPLGGLNQTPVSATLFLVNEHDLKPNQVQKIKIKMSPKEVSYPGANSYKPSALSIPFCTATAFVNKGVTYTSVWESRSPEVLSLMPCIEVISDDSLDPLSCNISVHLKEGSVLKHKIIDPLAYCFTLEEDIALIYSLIPEMAVSEKKARKAIDIMANLEQCIHIRDLVDNLVA